MKIKKLIAVLTAVILTALTGVLPSAAAGDDLVLRLQSNYDYPAVISVVGSLGETCRISFAAHRDWQIVNMQFTLSYPAGAEISNLEGFAPDILFNKRAGRIIGGYSSLQPTEIQKGEPLISFDFKTDEPLEDGTLYLCIEDMTVLTEEGEVLIFFAGSKTPDAPEVLFGDADGNGRVNIDDVTTLQKYLADFRSTDGSPVIDVTDSEQLARADVTFDGAVTVEDATRLQRYLAEYITSFV